MDRYKRRALSMSSASVPINGILPNTIVKTALTQCEATRQESVVDTEECKWIASKGFVYGTRTTLTLFSAAAHATIFLSAFLRFDAAIPVALLFIAAMLCFFLGLLCFLRKIYLATMNLRIGPR